MKPGLAHDVSTGVTVDTDLSDVSLTPLGTGGADPAVESSSGAAVIYTDSAPSSDIVVRPQADGIEAFTTLKSTAAPTTQTWEVDLQGGDEELVETPEGGVQIIDKDPNLTLEDAGERPPLEPITQEELVAKQASGEFPADVVRADPGAEAAARQAVEDGLTSELPSDPETLSEIPAAEDLPAPPTGSEIEPPGYTEPETPAELAAAENQIKAAVEAVKDDARELADQPLDDIDQENDQRADGEDLADLASINQDQVVAEILPPSSVDADGDALTTTLTVVENTALPEDDPRREKVAINVNTQGAQFPVVTDPELVVYDTSTEWKCCRPIFRIEPVKVDEDPVGWYLRHGPGRKLINNLPEQRVKYWPTIRDGKLPGWYRLMMPEFAPPHKYVSTFEQKYSPFYWFQWVPRYEDRPVVVGWEWYPEEKTTRIPVGRRYSDNPLGYTAISIPSEIPDDPLANIAESRAGGANLVRLATGWCQVETSPGSYSDGAIGNVDQQLRLVEAYNDTYPDDEDIKVIMILTGAPEWATGGATDGGDQCREGLQWAPDTADAAVMAYWRLFVNHMINHWQTTCTTPDDCLYDNIAAVEIWNEPNHWKFWGYPGALTQPTWEAKPARYATLFRSARLGMRCGGTPSTCGPSVADPREEVPIITGGLLPKQTDGDYLKTVLEDLDPIRFPDGIGVHAYGNSSPTPVASTVEDYERIGAAMRAKGAEGIPRWVTEWGHPTSPPTPNTTGLTYGTAEQATRMRDIFDGIYGRARPPMSMVVHRLIDGREDNLESRGMGTVRADRRRKTSFCLLALKVGAPDPGGCSGGP